MTDDFDELLDEFPVAITWGNRGRDLAAKRKRWAAYSNCYNQSVKSMYPENPTAQANVVNTVCAGCPTQKECLFMSLVFRDGFGVWGGTTERERSLLFKIIEEYVPEMWDKWTAQKEIFLEDFSFVFVENFYLVHGVNPDSVEELRAQREHEYLEACND